MADKTSHSFTHLQACSPLMWFQLIRDHQMHIPQMVEEQVFKLIQEATLFQMYWEHLLRDALVDQGKSWYSFVIGDFQLIFYSLHSSFSFCFTAGFEGNSRVLLRFGSLDFEYPCWYDSSGVESISSMRRLCFRQLFGPLFCLLVSS